MKGAHCCCVPDEDVIEKTLNLHCSYRDRDSVIYDFEGKNSIKKENFDTDINKR